MALNHRIGVLRKKIVILSLRYRVCKEMEDWYRDLALLKSHIAIVDPILVPVFTEVDAGGFRLHEVIKPPYVALVGAIIGQKISYTAARTLRGELYRRYGVHFTPEQLVHQDLSWLGSTPAIIIRNVTRYILSNGVNLETMEGINALRSVPGIGEWTLQTTLLTCLMSWDIFPTGDVFIKARMKRLYGPDVDVVQVSNRWAPYRSVVTWYLWRWF